MTTQLHGLTGHGYHCCALAPLGTQVSKARCLGPDGCFDCMSDVQHLHQAVALRQQLTEAVLAAARECVTHIETLAHNAGSNPWLRDDTRALVNAVRALDAATGP